MTHLFNVIPYVYVCKCRMCAKFLLYVCSAGVARSGHRPCWLLLVRMRYVCVGVVSSAYSSRNMAARNDGAILEKLMQHAEYAQKSEEELRELACNLTDFDSVFRRFRHLLEPAVDKAIDEVLIKYRVVFTHSQEFEMAHRRAKHELARVFHLPVKLFLSRLRQTIPMYSIAGKVSNFFLEYGALHAGLVVGNIRIEWGQEGIVEALPEYDIPDDDFVATVDGSKGELGQGAAEIHRRFSLADRERRTDDKIKLIIHTAEKKKEVLSNLVRVITSYNLDRKYDLFSCNCQHFVRDALAALGINEPPRFSGQLKDYLEHLKHGRIEVPEDFKNHATLDTYVERQLQAEAGTLSQHDMEYLLLHYYRLHLNSMPEDADDDWRCSVPTCKYEHLADRVDRESLLNSQFPPRTSASPYVSPIPPIAEVQAVPQYPRVENAEATGSTESREEELRRREEQRIRQIARDEQRAREVRSCTNGMLMVECMYTLKLTHTPYVVGLLDSLCVCHMFVMTIM